MGYIKCCVPSCSDKTSIRHRFPNPNKDLDRFQQWCRVIDHCLTEITPLDVYTLKRICHRHFSGEYFSLGAKRLHWNAVPTLFLPAPKNLQAGIFICLLFSYLWFVVYICVLVWLLSLGPEILGRNSSPAGINIPILINSFTAPTANDTDLPVSQELCTSAIPVEINKPLTLPVDVCLNFRGPNSIQPENEIASISPKQAQAGKLIHLKAPCTSTNR